ncbi:hybrid sensor histidine kinase/response regulator [Pseudomonas chlororaphis]|uniref:hybrid sensor histidine kinase/response regulator n=1 Tax=Pseudomonas chlororaphis TaxID=587753 RepID=UPI000F4ACE52|nr:hybrid sensor histidine kinase/response regulator [Pseudomonas chlororaphis]ROL89688.1 hypothetical protein BK637_10790 [Pseudomonas chlororaphis]
MKFTREKIRRLTKTSLRLNSILLVSFLFAIFFLGASYWAVYEVLQTQRVKVNYHFLRLMGSIHEHELFLLQALRATSASNDQPRPVDTDQAVRTLRHGSLDIHEGRGDAPSSTFSIVTPNDGVEHQDRDSRLRKLSLGASLSDFHNGFWSDSPYPAPQMFLLDLNSDVAMAIPAIEPKSGLGGMKRSGLLQAVTRIKQVVQERPPTAKALKVYWSPSGNFLGGYQQEMLAYVSSSLSDESWGVGARPHNVVAATLLELSSVNDYGPIFSVPVFESLDLISPNGVVLAGSGSAVHDYDDGYYLTLDGLLIKRSSGLGNSWHALYYISYKQLFQDAKWQLLNVFILLLFCVLAGNLLFRWHRRRVVAPADRYYGSLVDSNALSRTIIQAAPVALCVIREEGRELVMQNALALRWLGDTNDIVELTRDWHMFEDGKPIVGETCAIIGDLYLHARFAPANYQDESVLLCAFIDITAHKDAESALLVSRNVANAANAEKSRFLATMSHEIRTPLYGVVGTLELLGLTRLSLQQHGYLRTIKGSSNILLQLISDILDISKIESGEMSLDLEGFAPLEIVEEALRNYAATADDKGLLLYSCVAPDVPGMVLGDGMRVRQIVNNLLNNAIKFTQTGRVTLYVRVLGRENGQARLQWQVVDTGVGISKDQQARLFQPFFQADNQQDATSGTGLGLSICWQLCQMMQGTLELVSAPGLGSSFSFELTLPEVEAEVRLPQSPQGENETLYVRSPIPELSSDCCQWLEKIVAKVVNLDEQGEEPMQDRAVLVELLPEFMPVLDWQGARVIAEHDASVEPQRGAQAWRVNLHSRAGLACAVMAALGRDMQPFDAPEHDRLAGRHLGLRVLFAEDHPVNQTLLAEQLEQLGCTVTLVGNGEEALRQLEGAQFDVVLTDVSMPVMDGYELAQRLRQRNSTLPIIAVTANAFREEGERCIAAGMNAWLTKPIVLETLHGCLKRVVGIGPMVGRKETESPDLSLVAENDIPISGRVLELFLCTMDADLDAIRNARACNDFAEVTRLLHRVRGALAVAKAPDLIAACRELEASFSAKEPTTSLLELSRFLGRIEMLIERFKSA